MLVRFLIITFSFFYLLPMTAHADSCFNYVSQIYKNLNAKNRDKDLLQPTLPKLQSVLGETNKTSLPDESSEYTWVCKENSSVFLSVVTDKAGKVTKVSGQYSGMDGVSLFSFDPAEALAGIKKSASNIGPTLTITPAGIYFLSPFSATWRNENSQTGGITKVTIRIQGDAYFVRVWGSCKPTDCDWGEVQTPITDANDGSLSLKWRSGFAERNQQISLLEDGRLFISTYTHFIDKSGRKDYEESGYFTQS